MTTTDRPTLRQVIDSGQDPLDILTTHYDKNHGHLLDIIRNGVDDSDTRARVATTLDALEDDLTTGNLSRGMYGPGVVPPEPRPGFADEMRHLYGWEREVLADPSLVDAAVNAVADPMLRLELATLVDAARGPHPFEVVLPEGTWKCDACGTCFEAGEEPAIVATGRPNYSSAPDAEGYEPGWCAGCLQEVVHRARDLRVGVR